MTKYLVELTGNVEGITADGWKEMMKVVDDYKVGISNVYKVNGEDDKEVCDWIQGRIAAYRKDGENAKVHKVKSYENKAKATKRELTPTEKAFEKLQKDGEVKLLVEENGKSIYEELKSMCKEKNVKATGRFCNTYYKVILK